MAFEPRPGAGPGSGGRRGRHLTCVRGPHKGLQHRKESPMTLTKSRCGSYMIAAAMIAGGCGVSDELGGPDESEAAQEATPCSVPSFIAGAPTPVGWASLNGGTTGGGAATGQLVTTLSAFNTAAKGTTAAV